MYVKSNSNFWQFLAHEIWNSGKIKILSHCESLVEEIIALKYVLINGSHLFQAALFYIGINIQQYGAFLTKP